MELLGCPGGGPGRPWGAFWASGSPLGNQGRYSGGSLGGTWIIKKSSEVTFWRSLRAKYTYFQGFQYATFVNLMCSWRALGRPWEDFVRPRDLQGDLWGARGGPGGTGSASGALQGGSRTRKPRFWSVACFSRSAPDIIIIVVSAIFQKISFFLKLGPVGPPGVPRGGPERCIWRPCGLPGGHRES